MTGNCSRHDPNGNPLSNRPALSKRSQDLLHRLNSNAIRLCDEAIAEQVVPQPIRRDDCSGTRILDFGTGDEKGCLEAGIFLARICMAGLAKVSVVPPTDSEFPLPKVQITTDHPLLACMASQYAGFPLTTDSYFAMCSGPLRIARGLEAVLEEYGLLSKEPDDLVAVLESSSLPDSTAIKKLKTEVSQSKSMTLCAARTASLPGSIQVVARSVETTLHKLHEIDFDLSTIKNAIGSAPLPPIGNDDLQSLGWTNDSILYGAAVNLWVDTTDEIIQSIGPKVPSESSTEFGRPFIDIFNHYERDFYRIDKMLFSPAKITFNNLRTGRIFTFGKLRPDILRSSFRMGEPIHQTNSQ